MDELQIQSIQCPYCGELIDIDIDCSAMSQNYIEDCSVCCRPINLLVEIGSDKQPHITATHENE